MSFEQAKNFYDQHGYVVVPNFLSPEELQQLEENLDRYIREIVPGLPSSDAFYQDRSQPESLKQLHRMGQDEFFRNYVRHPQWEALAECLVGEPVNSEHPEWFNKPPGAKHVTPPHQDNFYFCLTPSNVVTLWLALDEIDTENGCLRYVEGSHRHGFRPHAQSKILGFSQGITNYTPEDFTHEVAVPLKPGDLVAHHGMTIHRADANISSTRQRRSFAMVYQGVSCQKDEEAREKYLAAASEQHATLGLT